MIYSVSLYLKYLILNQVHNDNELRTKFKSLNKAKIYNNLDLRFLMLVQLTLMV